MFFRNSCGITGKKLPTGRVKMRNVFQKLLWDHWQETSTQETTKKGSKLFVFCSLLGNNDSLGPQKSQVLRGGDASGV
jgi:hypothetical protein